MQNYINQHGKSKSNKENIGLGQTDKLSEMRRQKKDSENNFEKQEIERRKQKIDNEINRRLLEDRERRKKEFSQERDIQEEIMNKKSKSKDSNISQQEYKKNKGVYINNNGNSNINSSINQNTQYNQQLMDRQKKWDLKNAESKYYVQRNTINLKK
ncbi:hypothetical protein PPERSA_00988 [Pseudocohnilembus persalinus]|uniref:Uncharacterized protein n=1 Tax=Pseudocohnilembus persalinus TaxID=266149 RepID=A0A0V0R8Q1_PSEPJ|nr:hypothetical protein PPERSA_00988 [Pseudocohnilembus persalinus]|eukprot:KRX10818.1 hypothetical protein PPERSA_00988 [Pseudocohnilembus persalinus]